MSPQIEVLLQLVKWRESTVHMFKISVHWSSQIILVHLWISESKRSIEKAIGTDSKFQITQIWSLSPNEVYFCFLISKQMNLSSLQMHWTGIWKINIYRIRLLARNHITCKYLDLFCSLWSQQARDYGWDLISADLIQLMITKHYLSMVTTNNHASALFSLIFLISPSERATPDRKPEVIILCSNQFNRSKRKI